MKSNRCPGSTRPDRAGLTPIEVLVVLFCLILVAVLLVPWLADRRELQRELACQNRLREMGMAVYRYADEHEDKFPLLVDNGVSWTAAVLPYFPDAGPILDRLAKQADEESPVHAPMFLCPNGNQYATGSGCYVVNGGWGKFDNSSLGKIWEESLHTLSLDWNSDGEVTLEEKEQTRATGLIWREDDEIPAWTRLDVEAADGLSQTFLISENQSVTRWNSTETFELAFVVGLDQIELGLEETPFLVEQSDLGPFAINFRLDNPVAQPSLSSTHPRGINILFADSSVRIYSAQMDQLLLLRLMTPAGSEYGEPALPRRVEAKE